MPYQELIDEIILYMGDSNQRDHKRDDILRRFNISPYSDESKAISRELGSRYLLKYHDPRLVDPYDWVFTEEGAARYEFLSGRGKKDAAEMTPPRDVSVTDGGFREFNVSKFSSIIPLIDKLNLSHVCRGNDLMIDSPVGNQRIFYRNNIKANMVISGFCTAPDAAIQYILDLEKGVLGGAEIANTFNTPTMKRGIAELAKSVGIKEFQTVLTDSLEQPKNNGDLNILMTQLLSMISRNGSAGDTGVLEILKDGNNDEFRQHAGDCLAAWYNQLNDCVEPGSPILLMGRAASSLLKATFVDHGSCEINFETSPAVGQTLYSLVDENFRIFEVMHVAAFSRDEQNKHRWYNKPERQRVYYYLANLFPNHIEAVLPQYSPVTKCPISVKPTKPIGNHNDWSDLKRFTDKDVCGLLDILRDHNWSKPEVGYELADFDGEILAEAELAWEGLKLVVLTDSGKSHSKCFKSNGWRVFLLKDILRNTPNFVSLKIQNREKQSC